MTMAVTRAAARKAPGMPTTSRMSPATARLSPGPAPPLTAKYPRTPRDTNPLRVQKIAATLGEGFFGAFSDRSCLGGERGRADPTMAPTTAPRVCRQQQQVQAQPPPIARTMEPERRRSGGWRVNFTGAAMLFGSGWGRGAEREDFTRQPHARPRGVIFFSPSQRDGLVPRRAVGTRKARLPS